MTHLIEVDEVEKIFDAWVDELVAHHGDRTVAAVLSSPAIQAAFIGDIGQTAGALVTCDDCDATDESGWGDTPLCLACQKKADPSLICSLHALTHTEGELCPACKAMLV